MRETNVRQGEEYVLSRSVIDSHPVLSLPGEQTHRR